jgi:hypothetical protein
MPEHCGSTWTDSRCLPPPTQRFGRWRIVKRFKLSSRTPSTTVISGMTPPCAVVGQLQAAATDVQVVVCSFRVVGLEHTREQGVEDEPTPFSLWTTPASTRTCAGALPLRPGPPPVTPGRTSRRSRRGRSARSGTTTETSFPRPRRDFGCSDSRSLTISRVGSAVPDPRLKQRHSTRKLSSVTTILFAPL